MPRVKEMKNAKLVANRLPLNYRNHQVVLVGIFAAGGMYEMVGIKNLK
jgi:hypothetical protein